MITVGNKQQELKINTYFKSCCLFSTNQRRYDIRAPLCAFHVIKIILNVQIYMGAWVWNVNLKAHGCRTSSEYHLQMHGSTRVNN